MSYKIYWVPASSEDFVRGRNGKTIIAIVHHRMVGTLAGTDRTFQSTENRPVSTHFGIGYNCGRTGHPTGIAGTHIHQYVDLSDTAFGNGNYDSSGSWDNWGYPTSEINARTVSIEHQDNAHFASGKGKGVVPEEVIKASIWLDRLLIHGTAAEIRGAGVRARYDTQLAQIRRIIPGPRTLITHNDIAGRLKPSCWKPWEDDPIGYPRTRYVNAVRATTAPEEPDTVNTFQTPEKPTVAVLKEDPARPGNSVWMYTTSDLKADGAEVSLQPIRPLQFVGHLNADVSMVGYDPVAGDTGTTNKVMFVARTGIASIAPVTTDEVAALKAQVGRLEEQLRLANADLTAKRGFGAEVELLGAKIKA